MFVESFLAFVIIFVEMLDSSTLSCCYSKRGQPMVSHRQHHSCHETINGDIYFQCFLYQDTVAPTQISLCHYSHNCVQKAKIAARYPGRNTGYFSKKAQFLVLKSNLQVIYPLQDPGQITLSLSLYICKNEDNFHP
jgi:hypothetical protein